VHAGAIAYPTPYGGNLTPEEELTAINPTIELMNKVRTAASLRMSYGANTGMQVQYSFVLLSILASGFTKLSIAYFYRRLFVTRNGSPFDWAIRISVAIVVLWTISFFLASLFECGVHFSANWGSVEDLSYCTAAFNIDNAFVVSDLLTDILVLCLPLPVVSALGTKSIHFVCVC